MEFLIALFRSQPTAGIALVTSALAALVAVVVALLTQWLLANRSRSERLTVKLEELYALVAKARTSSDARHKKAREFLFNPPSLTADPNEHVHFSRDMPLDRSITMYVRLYFPELDVRRRELREQNQLMVEVFKRFSRREKVTIADIWRADLPMMEAFERFEDEMLLNRAFLVKEGLRRRKYVPVVGKVDPSTGSV